LHGPFLEAFKNKRKSLKILHEAPIRLLPHFSSIISFTLETESLVSWKALFHLRHLESLKIVISPQKNQISIKIENFMNSRLYLHLQKLVGNLKNLYISFQKSFDLLAYQFLEKISAQNQLFSSLSEFSLSVDSINSEEIPDEIITLQFQSYVTKLQLKNLPLKSISKFLSDPQKYNQLTELVIAKIAKNNSEEGLLLFNKLHQIQHLHTLKISIDFSNNFPFQTFLDNLTIPPSTKTITLDFQSMSSNLPLKLTNYAQWRNIQGLEFLKIQILCGVNKADEWNFTLQVLRALKSLQSLHVTNWCESKSGKLDFYEFYQSTTHLKSSLKTIHIETNTTSLQNFPENNIPLESLSLQKLTLFATMTGDTKLKHLFNLFPLETSQPEFIVQPLIIESKESLNKLLQDLSEAPKNLQISLDMDVQNLSPNELIETLQENLPKLNYKKFRRLNFCDIDEMEKELILDFKQSLQKYKVLDCIKVSDSQGRVLFIGKNFKEEEEKFCKEENCCQESFGSLSEGGHSEFFEEYVPDGDMDTFDLDNIGSDFSDDYL